MKHTLITAGLLVALLGIVPRLADAKAATVTPVAYSGWDHALRLSNGIVDIVIVPQIGRVMAFEFTGHPETNPFWNNPAWAGKPLPADPGVWANYGGDKLWPSPQSDWPKHASHAWPPDPAIDRGPYTVTRIKNGVQLTGPVSRDYVAHYVRDIVLRPGAAEADLCAELVKSTDARGAKNGFPIGIWSISQVRGDSTIFVPLNRHGLFPGIGYTPLMGNVTNLPNWRAYGDLLNVTRDPVNSTKVGVDDSAGWMATLYDGNMLFSHHFTRNSRATFPDKGTNAQVYTNPGSDIPYIEVEALGPLADLQAGHTITRTLSWRLQRLPRTPKDDQDARALVIAAMGQK